MEWWQIMLLVLAGAAVITLAFGFIFKKRFRINGRIYSFTAYDPPEDSDCFSPTHVCGKNRFYSRLLHSETLPRYTSRFSFVPFISNRKMIRAAEFRATSYLWEESDSVRVHIPDQSETLWVIHNAAEYEIDDDMKIPRNALASGGSVSREYVIVPGDGFALQKGEAYIFYFYRTRK